MVASPPPPLRRASAPQAQEKIVQHRHDGADDEGGGEGPDRAGDAADEGWTEADVERAEYLADRHAPAEKCRREADAEYDQGPGEAQGEPETDNAEFGSFRVLHDIPPDILFGAK